MLILGHRGASGYAPENTIKAFNLAFEQDADGIECDIIQYGHTCYVMHDLRVDRTTNRNGVLSDFTHEELTTFDVGEGEKIPTLAQLIGCIPKGKLCNLELKYIDDIPSFIRTLREFIARSVINQNQVLISSFNHQWLSAIQSLWSDLPVAYLIAHYPLDPAAYFQSLNTQTINIALDIIDKSIIDAAHGLNKKVMVYTVNHPEDVLKCKQIGVDGIFTNYPLLAKEVDS